MVGTPLWSCVREAARQILKAKTPVISCTLESIHLFDAMIGSLSDKQPARVTFPETRISNSKDIKIVHEDGSIVISKAEPAKDILWIPMDPKEGAEHLIEMIDELANAGYPGCVGCIGSISEGGWDESKSRELLNE